MAKYGWLFGDSGCAYASAIAALGVGGGSIVTRTRCRAPTIACACPPTEIVFRYDATKVLRGFAREVALGVAHHWNPPPIVLRWLRTGDESIRIAANRVADTIAYRHAASGAPRVPARSAMYSTTYSTRLGGASNAAHGAAYEAAVSTAGGDTTASIDVARRAQSKRLAALLTAGRKVYGQGFLP